MLRFHDPANHWYLKLGLTTRNESDSVTKLYAIDTSTVQKAKLWLDICPVC